ncbi:ABC-2 transporter permease [Alkalicoccobacillus murimartini]|uniref:ABC-type transport system involved in multi-copper enzyme maturation permease subunit n=1 Tax=Alkalicoccobacillus murimartini TaxID=171685 RepID=A0ABT9YHV2_9BACI|nr:ABC-2 transporter permease [Alkalicoccobacillus murimartini]MDQ0207439.1 ABC-type transport system involved in multi-copper enzyme maturation permease subunit [Alkalicoccobacillus murimartini]
MKGLILNQYYSVEKSIWWYSLIGFVAAMVLIFFENPVMQRAAGFLPLFLLATAALEVVRHEAISGWNKYVLTLPVKRIRVVQSHYLFFLILTIVGVLISIVAYMIAQFVFGLSPSAGYINSLLNIMGISFTMGFVVYPLTYILGTEKAETVTLVGAGVGIGVFFLSAFIFDFIPIEIQGLNSDQLFSLSFMIINFVLFIISYIVSIQVYKRKEF